MKKLILFLFVALTSVLSAIPATAEVHEVKVFYGHSFVPNKLTINRGDTVRWVWISSGHTVTSGKNSHNGIFATDGELEAGDTFKVKFSKKFIKNNPVSKNIYHYYCIPHLHDGMTGRIKIRKSSLQ